jgi:hypothetical protein
MSPEQVLADPLDIDTRSDVYSLGVILYEFLSGRLPYPISKKLHEAIQTIREADPAKLSSVNRSFRGDIENIVAKALEKDRTRRYASAEGMAGDIRRYLRNEPIVARPPSATYHLKKFTRRHKALVSGVAAVFVVLVAGVSFATWEARRATRSEQVAIVARDRAQSAERAASIAGNRAIEERQRADMERDRAVHAEEKTRQERDRALGAEKLAEALRVSMSRGSASTCSGLIYARVPISWPRSVCTVARVSLSVARATPKSSILGWPASSIRMLAGLRSR